MHKKAELFHLQVIYVDGSKITVIAPERDSVL